MTLWPVPSGDLIPGDFPPSFHGWLAWAFDPIHSAVPNGGFNGANGTLYCVGLCLPKRSTVTNVVMRVKTAGATLTSGQNFAGLWDSAGNLVGATADQSTAWTSTGIKTMALAGGPFNLPSGIYYAGPWSNGTTRPHFSGIDSAGWASFGGRYGIRKTSLTTTAPSTLDSPADLGGMWWVALS